MATPFPNIPPDISSSRITERAMNEVALGHGYEHRQPVGINYKRHIWPLSWSNMTRAEFDVIEAFLDAISDGSIATWTPHIGAADEKYVLQGEYTVTFPSGIHFTVTATFKRVYDSV